MVRQTDRFILDQPIWSTEQILQPHEVSLFRLTFTTEQPLEGVELTLFADTRYQVWLDGEWVGRGPARFARTYREYDVYPLEALPPGQHVLAVLAQWSPDARRSESVRPLLQGHLQGVLPDGSQVVWRTGTSWKAQPSPAWRGDAAPIHSAGLIGFTELLDLNQLSADWFQPWFSDAGWPQAVVVDPQITIQYFPRSIPFLTDTSVPIEALDGGVLLPERAIGELPAGTPAPFSMPFQADVSTPFIIETLSAGTPPSNTLILLDGAALDWQAVSPTRPDVYQVQMQISAGAHTLTFNPPAEGLTYAVSTANLSRLALPFEQGNHAGRRLLLADPVSQPEAVIISSGSNLTISFYETPAYAVLDLGHTIHGRMEAQVSGPAGTVIDIGWDERLLAGTSRPLPYPGSLHHSWNQVDSWILDGTSRQISTLDARSGRYVLIAAWGEGPVQIENLVIQAEGYPLTQTGTFSSSDPLLNTIWQIGVDTVRLNMADAYMDPWRERGQWWGDSYVIDQVNALAFGDAALLRRGLLFMDNAFPETDAPGLAPHNNGMHMLDYAMLWVHSLADHYRRTGDLALLQATYPTLQRFMDHLADLESPSTGLLDLPKTLWSLTAYIEPRGFHSRYGQSTALNALYSATLQEAAQIASHVENTDSQRVWLQRAMQVQVSLNTLLYLPEQHCYLTNIYQGVAYPPTPQAQAWALAYGVAPAGEQAALADSLLALLSDDPAAPNLEMYGFHWVLNGLGQAGYTSQAVELIKSYYGHMIDNGATSLWEHFNSYLSWTASLSHGWGSSPTLYLTTYYLGIRQVGPDEWNIQPALQAGAYASGDYPMPQGVLQVDWQSYGCSAEDTTLHASLQVTAPPGTHGSITFPPGLSSPFVSLNGQPIGTTQAAASIPLGEGSHTLELEASCAGIP